MIPQKNNKVYTVGSLTRQIKKLLEDQYPFLWITGEISNFSTPASGHSYFSLKDEAAVISCVIFKGQKRHLKFTPENGMKVKGMARLSLYEPRGAYQLIFEHMEPEGTGALQQAFEQLKAKLAAMGWFDTAHKKEIPFLPSGIHVITSGTGAAVRDIIQVAKQRCSSVPLEIIPVKVQGDTAEFEIARAIELANSVKTCDLIIIARGGGSLEDLWAFNTQTVAKAVFESEIPVISGVGHEIDFTIADFVVDLRAPTPSAAAQMALPDQTAIVHQILGLQNELNNKIERRILQLRERINDLYSRLKSPARVVDDFRFRLEDLQSRLFSLVKNRITYQRERTQWLNRALAGTLPCIPTYIKDVKDLQANLDFFFHAYLKQCKDRVNKQHVQLEALNPSAVLKRGYSITRSHAGGHVVMDADTLNSDDDIEIILSKGRLDARVVKTYGKENL
ncbi:exodeoxyribonuclease VII large subunit [Desulfobacter hydrogenophilus]|uniref:Exodeoxyribonuclease 7 large subunit n=1 Tax=Desulfobacter hydrogenophilus TaxID=2291 RepID=A0A328F9L9_9BACT|nr:exodeoxyribonuclease VII large subunit [Desulfobacter hydrogenophilus]NDY73058.1 exodeoxyribonuclease VII large subunit [Desulfobacter hydrogenophilus]QBH14692.1 exodeoxyribonuclease VII large subunit [Desulfobacter hydrogenophilus]RAM00906.1 exodeoxyribonuclease VII large subunit [Desulfobacter hydrogenophilus]